MPDFSKGLIPAIVVDDQTGQVLMLAYMNEAAYHKTIETKQTWFYSRSRQELWNKGATSGNYQKVTSIKLDCDSDTLLIRVIPQGPACHTGETSCFYQTVDLTNGEVATQATNSYTTNIFDEVMSEVKERQTVPKENSYTNYLFDKGIDKIGKKVIEEAGEVVIAAKNQDKQEIINEVSDLIYHSFVLMANQHVSLDDVKGELTNRFAKKGNHKGERPEIKEW
ncbi:bifunctional phosphoribosyl-AMP cyclohydrolase/phosphoribosyl-ATP diphosphatase HisIE [Aquibacillus sediminis]|uniref:bifunctional phosphoribosyl-AMP cyclohydrolase/phosphoribosyl-ATP diphosphatase HisIE n=1 Tax=Aquibacillus sediminis TaxID=2574734 RepID=UPI001107C5DE|nr:bifunctional phosphoribosyl-AMP cyclohydrolase/phosphoribosyl-ATP diphosphatase HisIE [Aquibacillus sediminis]